MEKHNGLSQTRKAYHKAAFGLVGSIVVYSLAAAVVVAVIVLS